MAQCEICTTHYAEGTNYCNRCGWYLADLSALGGFPDWARRPEEGKKACAQKLWSKIQEQHQLLSKQGHEIDHLKAQLSQVNIQLTQVNQNKQDIEQNLTQWMNAYQQLEIQNNQLLSNAEELNKQNQALSNEKLFQIESLTREKEESFRQSQQEFNVLIQEKDNFIGAKEAQIVSLTQEKNQLEAQIGENQVSLAEARDLAQKRLPIWLLLPVIITMLGGGVFCYFQWKEIASWKVKNIDLIAQATGINAERSRLSGATETLDSENNRLKGELANKQSSINNLASQNSTYSSQISDLNTTINSLRTERNNLATERNNLVTGINSSALKSGQSFIDNFDLGTVPEAKGRLIVISESGQIDVSMSNYATGSDIDFEILDINNNSSVTKQTGTGADSLSNYSIRPGIYQIKVWRTSSSPSTRLSLDVAFR